MHLLASLVLFVSLTQGVSQQRKANSPQSTQSSQSATDNQQPQPKIVVQPQSNQQPPDQKDASDTHPPRRFLSSPEWVSAVSTFCILLATIAYAIISYFALKKIGRQAELAEAQQIQMIRQEEYTRQQWHAMHEQGITMREQWEEMKRLADQATIAAGAAEKSAEAALKGVEVQEANLSQWIVMDDWKSVRIGNDTLVQVSCTVNNPSPFPLTLNSIEATFSFTTGKPMTNGVDFGGGRILAPQVPYLFHFEIELTDRMVNLYQTGTVRISFDCHIVYLNIAGKKRGQQILGNLFCSQLEKPTFLDFLNRGYAPPTPPKAPKI